MLRTASGHCYEVNRHDNTCLSLTPDSLFSFRSHSLICRFRLFSVHLLLLTACNQWHCYVLTETIGGDYRQREAAVSEPWLNYFILSDSGHKNTDYDNWKNAINCLWYWSIRKNRASPGINGRTVYLHVGRRGLDSQYQGGVPSGGCGTPWENWWRSYIWDSCTSSHPHVCPYGVCASGCSQHSWIWGGQTKIKRPDSFLK